MPAQKSVINSRRQALFSACLNSLAPSWTDVGAIKSQRADRLLFERADGLQCLVHLASVVNGYGFKAGEFKINFSAIVSSGPVYRAMVATGSLTGEESADERFFQTGSLSLIPGSRMHVLRLADDIEKVARKIVLDIEKLMHPLVTRVAEIRADLPKLIVECPEMFEKPFGTAVAVFALTGRLDELSAFWEKTAGQLWDRPATGEWPKLLQAAKKFSRTVES